MASVNGKHGRSVVNSWILALASIRKFLFPCAQEDDPSTYDKLPLIHRDSLQVVRKDAQTFSRVYLYTRE